MLLVPVYGGNSGGPVFFDFRNRQMPDLPSSQLVTAIGVAGLISQDVSHTMHIEGYFETITRRDPLGLAVVIPAEFIKQTVQSACRSKAESTTRESLPSNK